MCQIYVIENNSYSRATRIVLLWTSQTWSGGAGGGRLRNYPVENYLLFYKNWNAIYVPSWLGTNDENIHGKHLKEFYVVCHIS